MDRRPRGSPPGVGARTDPYPHSKQGRTRRRTLRDVIFKGQTANYIVVLTDGSEIIVSSAPHGLDLQPSEAVVVHWPVARGACFQV